MPRSARLIVLVVPALLAVLATSADARREKPLVQRGSSVGDGSAGDSCDWEPVLSGNGRFLVFSSESDNFGVGEPVDEEHIIWKDLKKGTVRVVASSAEGTAANDRANGPAVSKNGRFVVFYSYADNLVPNDTNEVPDVFVKDMRTGAIERVSVASDGSESDGFSSTGNRSISDNGRWVVFSSSATNLAAGDENGATDLFLHDRRTGETTLVSGTPTGGTGNGQSRAPVISGNGRFIAFDSRATDLTDTLTDANPDVFVYDVGTRTTAQWSLDGNGDDANGSSQNTALDATGRTLVFSTGSTDLLPELDESFGIAVIDLRRGTIVRGDRGLEGAAPNGGPGVVALSRNGRVLAFTSSATNLVPGDTNGRSDVFVTDLRRGTVVRAAVASDGTEISDNSQHSTGALAKNGKVLAFECDDDLGLPGDDDDGDCDVFVADVKQILKRAR